MSSTHEAPSAGGHDEKHDHGHGHGDHGHTHTTGDASHAPAKPAPDAHGHGGHGGGHGHGDDNDPSLSRHAGITMAGVGMLLALCSALVGAKRVEVIASMVEQTNTSAQYHAVSAKHRVLQSQLQSLHARRPDPKVIEAADKAVMAIEPKLADQKPSSLMLRSVRLGTKHVLNAVTPTQEDVDRFAWLVMKFADQREAAKEWSESYDEVIEAHKEGSEHYEWGQVCAELGIVIASVSMLFRSRKAWAASVSFGVIGVCVVAWTYSVTSTKLDHALHHTTACSRRYVALSSEAADDAADEELIKIVEGEQR